MSEFTFSCPHCGQNISSEWDPSGQTVQCPVCQKEFQVLSEAVASSPASPVVPSHQRFRPGQDAASGKSGLGWTRWLLVAGAIVVGVAVLAIAFALVPRHNSDQTWIAELPGFRDLDSSGKKAIYKIHECLVERDAAFDRYIVTLGACNTASEAASAVREITRTVEDNAVKHHRAQEDYSGPSLKLFHEVGFRVLTNYAARHLETNKAATEMQTVVMQEKSQQFGTDPEFRSALAGFQSTHQRLLQGNMPAEKKAKAGQVYRSLDGAFVLRLISRDEGEFSVGKTTYACNYAEQSDGLHVVVSAKGTTREINFRFTSDGIEDEKGVVLFSPERFASEYANYTAAFEQARIEGAQGQRGPGIAKAMTGQVSESAKKLGRLLEECRKTRLPLRNAKDGIFAVIYAYHEEGNSGLPPVSFISRKYLEQEIIARIEAEKGYTQMYQDASARYQQALATLQNGPGVILGPSPFSGRSGLSGDPIIEKALEEARERSRQMREQAQEAAMQEAMEGYKSAEDDFREMRTKYVILD